MLLYVYLHSFNETSKWLVNLDSIGSGTSSGGLEHIDSRHLISLRELNIKNSSARNPVMMKDLASALSVFIENIPETTPFEIFSLHYNVNYHPWDREEGQKDWALDEWKELNRMLSLPRMEHVKKKVEINVSYRDYRDFNSVVEFEGKVRDLLSIEGRLSHQIMLNISTNSLLSDPRSSPRTSADHHSENGSIGGRVEIESESVGEQARVKWSVTKRLKRFFLPSSPFRRRGPR